jgi:FRG domain
MDSQQLHQDPDFAAEFGLIKGPVHDYIGRAADEFATLLRSYGVNDALIAQALRSGYSLWKNILRPGASAPITCVWDTFYGRKGISALLDVGEFVSYLAASAKERCEQRLQKQQVKYKHEATVSSISEIRKILKSPPHAQYFEAGEMCFRGKTEEHFLTRPVPNPFLADHDGRERLILPAAWRSFKDDWLARPVTPDRKLLLTFLADHLVYYGIRPGKLWLLDFDDPTPAERRKFERRYQRHKLRPPSVHSDMAAIEQHYGVATRWLDVTFDLRIAAFFATHRFTKIHEATYQCSPVDAGNHQGVIYVFVFHFPKIRQTTDMIKRLGILGHCRPLRPAIQKCALKYCGPFSINESVADLHAVFKLAPDFSTAGLPEFQQLMPGPERDPFYMAALDIKSRLPDDVFPYSEFATYETT